MKTITFNTGRSYAKNGQVITATLHEDNLVTFMDHSRMVDGMFTMARHDTFSAETVQKYYDRGVCTNDIRSFQDGMSWDGVNSATINESAILAASK